MLQRRLVVAVPPLLTRRPPLLHARRVWVPDLPSHEQGALLLLAVPTTIGTDSVRLEEAHDALANPGLVVPAEQVEEAGGVDDVEAAVQGGQAGVGRVQDVARDEAAGKGVGVAEQVEAQLDVVVPQVGADEVGGGRAVPDQLPQDLAEAAAQVEEGAPGPQAGDNARILGQGGYVQVQEAPAADAGVWVDGERFLPL